MGMMVNVLKTLSLANTSSHGLRGLKKNITLARKVGK